MGLDLGQPNVGRALGAVKHAVDAAAVLGEQMEGVIEHLHVERGLVDRHPWQAEGLVPDDLPFLGEAREVRRPLGGRTFVPPLPGFGTGLAAADRFPVAGTAQDPVAQSIVHLVDRLSHRGPRGLHACQPPVEVQIGLSDGGPGQGRVCEVGQLGSHERTARDPGHGAVPRRSGCARSPLLPT